MQVRTTVISGIFFDLVGFCLWFVGLRACRLHCGSGHTWTKLTQWMCVSSAGLARQFVQAASRPSCTITSVVAGWYRYLEPFPTTVARVRVQVWSCGIWGGQSGARAGFLRVLRFPLPIFIPPISPQSPLSIIWAWYNRPVVATVSSGLSHPTNSNLEPSYFISILYCTWQRNCVKNFFVKIYNTEEFSIWNKLFYRVEAIRWRCHSQI
jgi:hypothetical protein